MSKVTPLRGISKITFIKYTSLPYLIAERLFLLFDRDNDSFLNFIEFVSIVLKVNSSDTTIKMKLVFDIYDFDKDGCITSKDVMTILSHTISIDSFKNKSLSLTEKAKE